MSDAGCFSGIVSSLRRKSTKPTTPASVSVEAKHHSLTQQSNHSATKSGDDPHKHVDGSSACCCELTGSQKAEFWDNDAVPLPKYELNEVFDADAIKTIESCIKSLDSELRELSLDIHDHPEICFEEKHAHDVLTAFMSSHSFKVEKHYLLPTAWKATWSQGSGGRTIGFNSEMDALPGVGHACGHNLIAIGGVAAALGVKAALEKSGEPGTVVLLGTPAEESGNGKIPLIKMGAYKDMHACLMMHPGPGVRHTFGTGPSLSIQPMTVEYFGHTAHASAAPWEAQNALDAAVLAYQSISVLRQQIKPSHRTHGIIEGKDWAPNIIPDYARLRWLVRAPSAAEVAILTKRVVKCFEAAALATNTKVKIDMPKDYVYDLKQNEGLAKEFAAVMNPYGLYDLKYEGAIGGSTDFGNVTYELPALHPAYAIPTIPNGGNHTRPFTDAARGLRAHLITLTIAIGIAGTGLRVLTDDAFYEKIKAEFEHSKEVRMLEGNEDDQ